MTERLIRRPEVESIVGLKRSMIYRLMREGRFPTPVKLSARAVAWRLSEVQAWQAERQAA